MLSNGNNKNRGAHGDSSFMLDGVPSSSENLLVYSHEECQKRYRTLWGGTVSGDKVVGYCRLHKRHLTEQQMRTKQCIPKGCGAFKKWDCPYWDHKHRMKELRQIKKEQGIPSWTC